MNIPECEIVFLLRAHFHSNISGCIIKIAFITKIQTWVCIVYHTQKTVCMWCAFMIHMITSIHLAILDLIIFPVSVLVRLSPSFNYCDFPLLHTIIFGKYFHTASMKTAGVFSLHESFLTTLQENYSMTEFGYDGKLEFSSV